MLRKHSISKIFFSILVTKYFSILKHFSQFWNSFLDSKIYYSILKFFLDSEILFWFFFFFRLHNFFSRFHNFFFFFFWIWNFFWIPNFFLDFESFFSMGAIGHHNVQLSRKTMIFFMAKKMFIEIKLRNLMTCF